MQQQRNFGNRYHLIDQKALEEKQIDRDSLREFAATSGMIQMGKQYNVVSIIGSQSTGKSTLLNKVFGTQFDVQDRSKSVGQTTIGIWISKDTNNNILVLDVEGSDSVERKSGENMVENQTALMALAMSHAFIINVFLNAVGQHTSCQLSIIKIIMQQNLKLFQQDTVKHIIFVIRDWDDDANLDETSKRLNGYLLNIWEEIPKPEHFKNTNFDQLFRVQVFPLVYYKMKKEFDQQTNDLKDKLSNQQNQQFLFQGFDYDKNVLMNDVPQYLFNIWDVISHNKDLNLPNEKILISNMRCQQIKGDALEEFKKPIEELANEVKVKVVEKFGQICGDIQRKCIERYTVEAKDYHKDVYLEKQKELSEELVQKFYTLFQRQSTQIKNKHIQKLMANLEDAKQIQITQLPGVLIDLENLKLEFNKEIKDSILIEGIWNEEDHINTFSKEYDNTIKQFVENQLVTYKQKLDNIIKSECDKIVSNQVMNITPKFWQAIDIDYYEMLHIKYEKYKELLQGLKIDERQGENYLIKFEEDGFYYLKQVLQIQSGRFKEQLFQQFKQLFTKTTEGLPRDWQKMREEEIFHAFTESKDKIFELLDMLKIRKIKFRKINIRVVNKQFKSLIVAPNSNVTTTSNDYDNEDIVISDVYYSQIKSQIIEDMDIQYQDAIQKHKQDFLQNIPKPFWFLLLFFMYDDVLRWMGNPLFLYPILIIICFIGFCIAIGLHSLPKIAFQQVIKSINGIIGPLIFGGLSKLKSA